MSRVEINIEHCDGTEYVLFPACCYNGNKFKSVKRAYPPVYLKEECKVDVETIMTDVPRLNQDGSGKIQVTTGDVATPCVGVWVKESNKAIFVFTIQEINGKNIGLGYEQGKIELTYPAKRDEIYLWPYMRKNEMEYKEIDAEIPYCVKEFACSNMREFYELYYLNRKCMGLNDDLPKDYDREEIVKIQLDKFNECNWNEKAGFYAVTTKDTGALTWATGWVGGGMSSYALMKLGGPLEYERGLKTLDFMLHIQAECGVFPACADSDGNVEYEWNDRADTKDFTLIRRSADALYFIFKHFGLMESVPKHYEEGAKRCADYFVGLWKKYHQIGQIANTKTGEIVVGGSAAGALVPAGLVSAYQYFQKEEYLQNAEEICRYFVKEYLEKGFTNGGPGDILQSPDSESAFALLESCVCLAEATNKKEWIDNATFAAQFCSSWVVSYNYKFPKGSEFNRLDKKTIGTVFANVQNKHSAPAICTLSGDSLYRLYKITGDKSYYRIYEEITKTTYQYLSTDKNPIYSWKVPKDATANNQNNIEVEPEKLPQGYMCERVNMSDWETEKCVGGVFNGSCWCEVSNLLVLAEDWRYV